MVTRTIEFKHTLPGALAGPQGFVLIFVWLLGFGELSVGTDIGPGPGDGAGICVADEEGLGCGCAEVLPGLGFGECCGICGKEGGDDKLANDVAGLKPGPADVYKSRQINCLINYI